MKQRANEKEKTAENWPDAVYVVATIIQEGDHALINLNYACRILVALFVSLVISLTQTIILLQQEPVNRYILTKQNGDLLPLRPLDRANHDDKFVIDWTIASIEKLMTIDHVNYRKQFQVSKKNLTTVGWKNFENAMILSGNHKAILGNNLVANAVAVGPGRMAGTGILLGRYRWDIEFPLTITYHKSSRNSETSSEYIIQKLRLSVTVIRVPEYLNESGLGIRAIIAE